MSPAEQQALHFSTHLGTHQSRLDTALHEMSQQRIVARIWEQDHTVWKPQPAEISNRLGWLRSAHAMRADLERLQRFAQEVRSEGYTHALVLGMGGSSLAPELLSHIFGSDTEGLRLAVLDSTDPGAVATYTELLDPSRTLFVVSSKSGTTVETLSLFKHFYNHVGGTQQDQETGRHFVAITDPQSPLADLANRYHFRDVFLADAEIGGRYSALSHFGLVPAALLGIDLPRLLDNAEHMMQACDASRDLEENPGARLGAILGELAQAGRDKATLLASPALRPFGAWVEQLLAESTGKEGKGIVPVVHEPMGLPEGYGNDRLFIHLAFTDDDEQQTEEILEGVAKIGHPVVHLHLHDPYELGGQFLLWELATAVAGHRLGINPFDQPNVEAAKQRARSIVATYNASGALPDETPAATYENMRLYGPVAGNSPEEALQAFLQQAQPGDYVAFQAYLQPPIDPSYREQQHADVARMMQDLTEIQASLLSMCARIRDRYHLAATFGYGPRYLHSTGQLHKGDAGRGLFIQLTTEVVQDVPIPAEAGKLDASLNFGTLEAAQALGDRQALEEAGRRIIRFHFGRDVVNQMHQLNHSLV
jgi:glucose-6-phosphate isomerase